MQYKFITIAIASLAVSTAIAKPIAVASPNTLEARAEQAIQQANAQAAELVKLGQSAADSNKQIAEKYEAALDKAYQENYVKTGAKLPTANEIQQLRDFIAENGVDKVTYTGPGSNHKRDAAADPFGIDVDAGINIGGGGIGGGIGGIGGGVGGVGGIGGVGVQAGAGFGIQAGGNFGWPFAQGFQLGCPFVNNGALWNYNLGNVYGCFGAGAALYGGGWGFW